MKNKAAKYLGLFFIVIMPLLTLSLLTGCTGLLSKQPLQTTTYYSLELVESRAQAAPVLNSNPVLNTNARLPTLVIHTPKATAGFDTRRMMYTRHPHQLEYFARNEWVDTPARMLQTLMVSAIEQTGDFNAVLPKYSLVKSELSLESEIVRLIQIFPSKPVFPGKPVFPSKPSQLQFTLRVAIIDNTTGKVVAQREFSETVTTTSNDPIGGVVAANQAVNVVLEKISAFTHEATITWHKSM